MDAKQIAAETHDAYSRSRYTDAGWIGIIRRMQAEGFTAAEIKWVLESKHMRWAADNANRTASTTAADFHRYTNLPGVKGYAGLRRQAQADLGLAQAKGLTGADLAGDCEGEDIADLIDFARAAAAKGDARAKAILDRIASRR